MIYIPKMISIPFLPEIIVPAELITLAAQTPIPQGENRIKEREGNEKKVDLSILKTLYSV